jgi:hypothetical protein
MAWLGHMFIDFIEYIYIEYIHLARMAVILTCFSV